MKKNLTLIVGLFLGATLCLWAGQYQASPLLNGTTLKLYNGTGDTAVTWAYDDSYNTNRTYVNAQGTTTTPKSTNSTTGVIAPTFNRDVPSWSLLDGAINNNLALSVTYTFAAAFTNNATIYFQKSANGVPDYDDNVTNSFSFLLLPNLDPTTPVTTITNLPSTFIQGTSHIRLWKVVGGANPTDNGNITLNRVYLSGYAP